MEQSAAPLHSAESQQHTQPITPKAGNTEAIAPLGRQASIQSQHSHKKQRRHRQPVNPAEGEESSKRRCVSTACVACRYANITTPQILLAAVDLYDTVDALEARDMDATRAPIIREQY